MRRTVSWLLGAWVGCIIAIVVPWTSFVDHARGHRVLWVPFVTPPVKAADIIGNVILYVPLGYLQARRKGTGGIGASLMPALVLSILTEGTQLFSHSRFPSSTDVVCNVFGAALGGLWGADAGGRRRVGDKS